MDGKSKQEIKSVLNRAYRIATDASKVSESTKDKERYKMSASLLACILDAMDAEGW